MHSYDLADTLAQVNAVRAAFGAQLLYDLPTSRPGDTSSCLFYRALSDIGCVAVGSETITFRDDRMARTVAELWGVGYDGDATINQPSQMSRVVTAFDEHELAHYEVALSHYE